MCVFIIFIDELALTKIGILWRDRMVQGWKKVHGTNAHPPKDASFGVRLENAPPGVTNEVSKYLM